MSLKQENKSFSVIATGAKQSMFADFPDCFGLCPRNDESANFLLKLVTLPLWREQGEEKLTIISAHF
jgi:hypothetical protein